MRFHLRFETFFVIRFELNGASNQPISILLTFFIEKIYFSVSFFFLNKLVEKKDFGFRRLMSTPNNLTVDKLTKRGGKCRFMNLH